jgi:hypothetical protein
MTGCRNVIGRYTTIRVRMKDNLSSENAAVGDRFGTTVVDPVYVRGVEVIPAEEHDQRPRNARHEGYS